MAKRDLEQILDEEYKRLTRGVGASKSVGLMDAIRPRGNTPSPSSTVQALPVKSMPKLAGVSASPASPASASINKGYTLPAPPSPPSEPAKASSVVGEIGKTALTLFTSGLGVMPLVSGLAGLFGGGESPAPAPLVKYAMPRPIQITAANSRNGEAIALADYSQDGAVRSFGNSASEDVPASSPTQIVVNVQAMDSRSFLDHSQEIAQAVRDAMLNMHALNDVVNEL